MLDYLKKFKNTGTILGLVGLVGTLLIQFGIKVDITWLNNTAQIICAILVVLGICNNPETIGVDLPTKNTNAVETSENEVKADDTKVE